MDVNSTRNSQGPAQRSCVMQVYWTHDATDASVGKLPVLPRINVAKYWSHFPKSLISSIESWIVYIVVPID